MKKAMFDEAGLPIAFYDPSVHVVIPAGTVDITDEQWLELLNHAGARRWDGTTVVPYTPPPPDLVDYKLAAKAAVDTAAGSARARFITVAPGQDATYMAKAAQAETYAAAGYPADLTGAGYIEAEIARLGLDPALTADRQTACDSILTIRATWIAIDAEIERVRLVGKRNVMAATDHAAVAAARDAAVAALDAIRP